MIPAALTVVDRMHYLKVLVVYDFLLMMEAPLLMEIPHYYLMPHQVKHVDVKSAEHVQKLSFPDGNRMLK